MSSPTQQITQWLNEFGAAVARSDFGAAASLFGDDSYWRDLVSFTWNIKTAEGPQAIRSMLEATMPGARASNWTIQGEGSEAGGVTEAWFTFETATGRGRGHLRLIGGKAWTLLTTLQELKGFEEKRRENRPKGVEHGAFKDRKTWLDSREEEARTLGRTKQPYVVVIGGGQAGIILGARLRKLGVPALIVEKNARPGDSWRNRYKSLCLHDPVWYDHLPYLPFPDDWPVFSPKDKIGDWLESYTKVMELNYWSGTECKSAHWRDAEQEWEVTVERNGETVVLRPKHIVFATGMSAVPNLPDYPGIDRFKGVQVHSSKFKGGDDWKGKKAVVVGSNNSAHDICADLWEHGAQVTMVQRSTTHVARSETLMDLALGGLYSEAAVKSGIDTNTADLIFASLPYKALGPLQVPVYQQMKDRDAEFYRRLEKAGFQLDFGDDESGLFMKYLRRGSGYYIDVGASELVANGSIRLKNGVIDRVTETGLVMKDGTELAADLIVWATGYGSMNGWIAQLVDQETADKVGKCWGLGSGTKKDPGPWEGELRNMWKPTQAKNLWMQGGNLHQNRHYSLCLALQLKARMESIPTPVYGLAPSYHKS
ncbi:MAG TPA: NAD(P)/FAD-dependent oxidoreductase [Burkholderiaceae bacterium]|nr:NAD(P)/FAD-dependent oxidoreductase [Burkholderiaceae bacterium]